jgi:hypothetical protein
LEKLAVRTKAPFQRHREEPETNEEAYVFYEKSGYPSGNGTDLYGPYTVHSVVGYMDDVVTPGYNRIIAEGGTVNNPCLKVHVEILEEDGNWSHSCPGGRLATLTGPVTSHFLLTRPCELLVEKVDQKVLEKQVKLRAIAGIDKTPYAMGEDAFEIRETLGLLRHPLKSIFHLTEVVRRARSLGTSLRSSVHVAQAIADNWLTYRFAMMPLVRSASDIYESLFRKEEKLPPRLHAGGSASDGAYEEDVFINGGSSDYVKYSRSCLDNVSAHATILYEVKNPITDWRRTYGLRWKDLPTTLWQIVPLSFLVDRLVNIQQGIQGLTNLLDPSIRILAASYAVREDLFQTIQAVEHYKDDDCTNTLNGGVRSTETTVYTRAPWVPSVGDIVPGITPLNLVKDAKSVADLLALILQRVRV